MNAMSSGSSSSYQESGAMGPQDPPDECSHGMPEDRCSRADDYEEDEALWLSEEFDYGTEEE